MTALSIRLLRWLCDPAKLEYLEGDLEELRESRAGLSWARDALSLWVRHSRFPGAMRRHRLALAALTLLGIGLLLRIGRPAVPDFYTVSASDPAGAFTLQFRDRHLVAATLDGAPVSPARLVQRGSELVIAGGDNGRDFRIALRPGGIAWQARQPSRD